MSEVSQNRLRVLLVEDSEDDADLLLRELRRGGRELEHLRVDTPEALEAALQRQDWDVILADFSMPRFSGTDALHRVRARGLEVPFIFVSGTIGEDTAVQAMKSGAQDYIMKGNLKRVLPAVERELAEARMRRERREAERMLRKLSRVVEQSAESVFITDPNGRIEYVNPAFEHLTGYLNEEAYGRTPALLKSGRHGHELYSRLWDTVLAGGVFRDTLINRRKDGGLFYEEKIIAALKDEQGNISHFVSTGRDITERVQTEAARARLVAILEATTDLVAILEPEGNLQYLNASGRSMCGMRPDEEIAEHRLQTLFPPWVVQRFENEILPAVREKEVWSGELVLRCGEAGEVPVSLVMLSHRDDGGEIAFFSAIARDITERKAFEAELRHRATHDMLTGLANRVLLNDRLDAELSGAKRGGGSVAVLFLDLDNFKRINDSLGHAAGDQLLGHVARRIQSCLRPSDTIARHGGDEFTIVISGVSGVEDVLVVLRKVRNVFDRPILLGPQEVYVTFSAGIAVYPHDGTNPEILLRNADAAMYRAKAGGRGQYRFYAAEMNARGQEILQLEAELRRALERDEFRVHYQPQLALRDNRVTAMEALIRWQHPDRGLVPPAEFVPLLEDSGLIVPVGEWILRQVLRECRACRASGADGIRIAVNVSAVQFREPGFVERVARVLREEKVPAGTLELEITENIVMHDAEGSIAVLRAIHELGVRLTIDDFGTGYSSLAYLKRFPLDALKIDRAFVQDITTDPNDAAIVEASISLAHKLGLEVVAEGVETAEQLKFLHNRGCDTIQGYYLCRPVPAREAAGFLHAQRPRDD